MPRRSPPTPLRLYQGPLPSRGKPRHTMPSMPIPAFVPAPIAPIAGPVPRARAESSSSRAQRMVHTELPALSIPDYTQSLGHRSTDSLQSLSDSGYGSGPSSPTSAGSAWSASPGRSARSSREFVRGPWDHSGAIRVPFDVDTVLSLPRPAAINVR